MGILVPARTGEEPLGQKDALTPLLFLLVLSHAMKLFTLAILANSGREGKKPLPTWGSSLFFLILVPSVPWSESIFGSAAKLEIVRPFHEAAKFHGALSPVY